MRKVDREKQVAEAEELLGPSPEKLGFGKGLFFGRHQGSSLAGYPNLLADTATSQAAEHLKAFCQAQIDPVAIDRNAEIPQQVIEGLGKLGVLGACLPTRFGGRGMSQTAYCRLIEVLGGHCASTALFVNAHHSIGPRSLVLFGTAEQQARYLPKLCTGEWLSAFALTETEAGSDAANVQTTATPTEDGRGFKLNGSKRWITNGGIAQVLTVMARTPVPQSKDSKITAFIVTPDMPGFEVVEKRMPKCGVRGTVTSRLAFHDMFVPKENILGEQGKGLRVALTVLDFGRTTFGASCTGAAKTCLRLARTHAKSRVQFGEPLANFELVKEKLANMAAGIFAMEAATYQTAALIDSGVGDFMLETAILKVFATETLWKILYDTFQIHGGLAYFLDQPFERMMRDARINQIGEGANDVLRTFTALVGMRDVGLELQGVLKAAMNPLANLGKLGRFAGHKLESIFSSPHVDFTHSELAPEAIRLGALIGTFGGQVEKLLRTYQESILERQYQLGRVADAAIELFTSACVLRRIDSILSQAEHNGADAGQTKRDLSIARYYLLAADRRINQNLAALWANDDEATTAAAEIALTD
jgi:alkylation response protein AidB-like acyl-CoA dehydrogenase